MVKSMVLSIFVMILISPGIIFKEPLLLGNPETQQQKEIQEVVEVINVEVPVRVFYKGKPVKNLTRDDFKLYENNKLQKIHGFYVKRKKIIEAKETTIATPKKNTLPRTFVLVYQITDFNDEVKKSIEYLFEKIFQRNDTLLVFANDKSLKFPEISNKEQIKEEIKRELKKQGLVKRNRLILALTNLETQLMVKQFSRNLINASESIGADTNPRNLHFFLKRYLGAWEEYKKHYLIPGLDNYYYFSKYLEKIKSEKWVFNFYQFELFPRIGLNNRTRMRINRIASQLMESYVAEEQTFGRMIDKTLNQIDMSFNVAKEFPHDQVSKLFYKSNATFHSFFMKSSKESFSEDFTFQAVANSIEDSFKSLTKITGGIIITSNNLVNSLKIVEGKEDIYYMLTYVPEVPDFKTRKIMVKVKNKKYKVLYDNNKRANYLDDYIDKMNQRSIKPGIKIEKVACQDKKLSIKITDFFMKKVGEKMIGKLKVRIRVINQQGAAVFDTTKHLDVIKNNLNISIPFNQLKQNEYQFFIDVTDLLTNKTTNRLETLRI